VKITKYSIVSKIGFNGIMIKTLGGGWGICTILILGKKSYETAINLCCSIFDQPNLPKVV
jgi:hypothetical protein